MTRFIFKKILSFCLSLFFIITVTFFLMKILPGNPFSQMENLPKEVLDSLYSYYGLDRPLFIQYVQYLKGILTFDFGPSYIYHGRSVNQILRDGFPVTFLLGMQSFFLSVFFGLLLGSIAAIQKKKWHKSAIIIFTSICLSIPNFVMASFLQYFLSMKLHLFPVARWESFSHTIMPTITLSTLPIAFIARLVRNSLSKVYEQEYIQTALSKGLSTYRVFFKHCLRNSLLPVIAYLGPLMTYLITGSFVTEKIFAIPGLGMWMIHSILSRDYTVILGLTVFYSFVLLFLNLLVDIIYGFIDPRITLFGKKGIPHESTV